MRIYSTVMAFILISLCSSVSAVEPVTDQQLMLYYQIPLGGDNQNSKHKFGLRFDRTSSSPGEVAEFSSVMKKPAVFDLQMRHNQPLAFKIHGIDYTEKLYTLHADAQSTPEETPAETPDKPAEEATATGTTEEKAEDKKTVVQKTLDEMPAGVIIGVAFGIAVVAGLGF